MKHLEVNEKHVGPFRYWIGKWKYKSRLARFWRMLARNRIEGRRVVVR